VGTYNVVISAPGTAVLTGKINGQAVSGPAATISVQQVSH